MQESVCHNRELSVCLMFVGHHLGGIVRMVAVATDRSEEAEAGTGGVSGTQTGGGQARVCGMQRG